MRTTTHSNWGTFLVSDGLIYSGAVNCSRRFGIHHVVFFLCELIRRRRGCRSCAKPRETWYQSWISLAIAILTPSIMHHDQQHNVPSLGEVRAFSGKLPLSSTYDSGSNTFAINLGVNISDQPKALVSDGELKRSVL